MHGFTRSRSLTDHGVNQPLGREGSVGSVIRMRQFVSVGSYAALLVLSALPHVGAGEFGGAWPEKKDDADPAITKAMEAVRAGIAACREDPTRPVYHFRPPARWMNDICGAIFYKGTYHIFYQINPYGDGWGSDGSSWGHARSRDLARWEHLPIALHPMTARGERRCNSGSVAINDEGTPMIFYTFVPKHAKATRLGKREQWAAAAADDDLLRWRRVEENPLLAAGANGVPANVNGGWSDPFVFKVGGRTFATFKSCGGLVAEARNPTLTEWKCVGRMDGVSGECPNFFKLGDKWVLLRSTYPPSYRVGRFDPEKIAFVETEGTGGTLDYVYGPKRPGPNHRGFYGTNVLFDGQGRCVLFGWVSGFKTGRGWDGCMSLPRIIRLDGHDNLLQTPAPEIEKLRGEGLKVETMVVASGSKVIPGAKGDAIEAIAEFAPGDAKAFGLKLRCSEDGNSALVIRHDRENLNVAGTDVPAPLGNGSRRLKLHVFLDKSVMEVFVDDGRACVTRVVYPGRNDLGLEVFAEGGRATLLSLDLWRMTSIWRHDRRMPG